MNELHSTPSPAQPIQTPVTIKRGDFTAHIYNVPDFLDFPLTNLRKLWKLMFETAWENESAIDTITEWLPVVLVETEEAIQAAQAARRQTAWDTETMRRNVAMFGSVATKEQKADVTKAERLLKAAEKCVKDARARHAKAHKLQVIFNELAENARF